MQKNLDKYTQEIKTKLDRNFLSPLFIRLANLLYINEQYEECISVCKTGLDIYPNYLTAKLILLKAFLKAEYLNEAEILFNEIRSKITNKDMLGKLDANIQNLKSISRQEKIYYTKSPKNKFDYKSFVKKFDVQENLFSNFTLNNFFSEMTGTEIKNDKEFQSFLDRFESFHFDRDEAPPHKPEPAATKKPAGAEDMLNKIRIVTETLADIYAEQGNYKEALDAYNMLLRAGSGNSKRIEEKIYELERNMLRYDKI